MKEAIIIFSISMILIVSIFSVALFMTNIQCKSAYENYQPQWGFISGCRIMVDGKLTPVNIVRELN